MKRKNVLFVFADQWRRGAVGYANDEPVLTPNIDAFAAEAVVASNAVSSCPLCSPARASLMTGKHPMATGVFTNCKTGTSIRLQDDEVCIAEVLKAAGYQTGYIGKWHLDEPEANHTDSPPSGAVHWDAYTPPGVRRHGFDFWYAYNACDNHTNPHYWADGPTAIISDQWSPIHETDVALSFLEKSRADAPFALFISWNPPHSPYFSAPPQYWEPYEGVDLPVKGNLRLGDVHHHTYEPFPLDEGQFKRLQKGYYSAITGLDDQFGRIVAYLKEHDLFDDTLIILTADHGDMLGSHQLIGKHVWYEESVGIPLLVGGMQIPCGRTDTVIGSPDLTPTILDLLDLPIPSSVQGVSVAQSLVAGATDEQKVCYLAACPGRELFLREFAEAGEDPRAYGWRAVRSLTHLYVVDVGYDVKPHLRRELYDLVADPLQLEPLALDEAHPLEQGLVDWLEAVDDPFLMHIKER